MIWLIFKVLKTAVLVSFVMAYCEIGPGGELIGNMIESTKNVITSINYADWWNGILANLKAFAEMASVEVAEVAAAE